MGFRPLVSVLDRASAHSSKVTTNFREDLGFTAISQTARSLDFSMLDAIFFSAIERDYHKKGA